MRRKRITPALACALHARESDAGYGARARVGRRTGGWSMTRSGRRRPIKSCCHPVASGMTPTHRRLLNWYDATGARCRGVTIPIRMPSGSARRCCSRRRSRPSAVISRASCRPSHGSALAAAPQQQVLKPGGTRLHTRPQSPAGGAADVASGGELPRDVAGWLRCPAWALHSRSHRQHLLRHSGTGADGNVPRVFALSGMG